MYRRRTVAIVSVWLDNLEETLATDHGNAEEGEVEGLGDAEVHVCEQARVVAAPRKKS